MSASTPKKLNRNSPCHCGSGKKFKACCAAAEAPFKSRQAPKVEAFLIRARQAARLGDFDSAEFYFREVLKGSPLHAEALSGVGQALCWRQRRREGTSYLIQAARQLEKEASRTRDPRQLIDLSAQLQHWGEINSGLKLARLAIKLAPKSAAAQNNLALCLSRINLNAEAMAPAIKACQLLPGHPGCEILVAVLEERLGQTDQARERLERAISADQDPPQTARAWLELGLTMDRLGHCDEAFAAFQESARRHRLLPETQRVNADAIFQTLHCDRLGFDGDLLNRWAGDVFADGLPEPAFLFGFLRSGTTLTERILGSHPGVMASDEIDIIRELWLELARISDVRDNNAEALRRIDLEQARHLRRLYWQRVEDECGPDALKLRFVDKLALHTLNAGLIATLFPEARILFALRDPRDVALSCFMQAFSPAPATVNLLSWEGVARQYAAVMDLWLHLRAMIPCRTMELRYEDGVANFESTYRKVFAFLDVEWHADALTFHEKARGVYISTPSFVAVSQPLYQSAMARWRRYEKHIAPIAPILAPYIAAFGYT